MVAPGLAYPPLLRAGGLNGHERVALHLAVPGDRRIVDRLAEAALRLGVLPVPLQAEVDRRAVRRGQEHRRCTLRPVRRVRIPARRVGQTHIVEAHRRTLQRVRWMDPAAAGGSQRHPAAHQHATLAFALPLQISTQQVKFGDSGYVAGGEKVRHHSLWLPDRRSARHPRLTPTAPATAR
jgi:hypothetical protein